jgi:hypothetical protein
MIFKKDELLYEIIFKGVSKIVDDNFRGPENHTYTIRKKVFGKIVKLLKYE